MRDGTIVAMQENSARRESLIFQQFHYLKTRQEAMEKVLYQSNLLKRCAFIMFPAYFLTAVDAMQDVLIQVNNAALKAAQSKPKIHVPV